MSASLTLSGFVSPASPGFPAGSMQELNTKSACGSDELKGNAALFKTGNRDACSTADIKDCLLVCYLFLSGFYLFHLFLSALSVLSVSISIDFERLNASAYGGLGLGCCIALCRS